MGEVVEGTVKPGMLIAISLNSALSVTAKVSGVEIVCGEGACETGIVIECESDDELEALTGRAMGDGEALMLTGP